MTAKLVLASSSPFRRALMEAAGLSFSSMAAAIDERQVEAPLLEKGAGPSDIAAALAVAKATVVASKLPGHLVIGSDQIMSMGMELFHKCKSPSDARRQLAFLRGKTHRLSSAVAIVRDTDVLWSGVETADLTFRNFSDGFLDRYMEQAGDKVLLTVGAYSYEGLGQQLFERVEGDYFTIIGLPMLPLLRALRKLKAIDD